MSNESTIEQWLEMIADLEVSWPSGYADAETLPLIAALLMIEQWTGVRA